MNSSSARSKAWRPDPHRPLPSAEELHDRDPRRVVANVRRGDAHTIIALAHCTAIGTGEYLPPRLGPSLLEENLIGAVLDHYSFPASIQKDTTAGDTTADGDDPTLETLENKGQAFLVLFNVISCSFREGRLAPQLQAKYLREVSRQLQPLLACLSMDNPQRLLLGDHFHWKFAVGAVTMFIHNMCMFLPDQRWWDRFRFFGSPVSADNADEAAAGNADLS